MSILQAGELAPVFTLPTSVDTKIGLETFRDKNVVLVFYPNDWSPVCGAQLPLYNEMLPLFQKYNAQLLGISVDSVWSHLAYTQANKLQFPLLADFEPKGAVSREYGVYRASEGRSERAIFVIDTTGIIHWSYLAPIDENPGADGILKALEDLDGQDELI